MRYGVFHIYLLKNDADKIKIGLTRNFDKRLYSLSGSNTGGNLITDYYVSPPTFLYTLEAYFHHKYEQYRIKGTEWFVGITFEEVKKDMEKLFNSEQYLRTNQIRKNFNIEHFKNDLEKVKMCQNDTLYLKEK